MSFELLAFKNLSHVHFCRYTYVDMIKIYSLLLEVYYKIASKLYFGSSQM